LKHKKERNGYNQTMMHQLDYLKVMKIRRLIMSLMDLMAREWRKSGPHTEKIYCRCSTRGSKANPLFFPVVEWCPLELYSSRTGTIDKRG